MKRDALQWLIAPLTVEELVADYWMQRSLHIPGDAEKVRDLFSVDAFYAAVAAAARRPDAAPRGFEVRAGPMRAIAPATIANELAAGNTICVSAIELGDAKLTALAAELKRQLTFPGRVSVNAYLSPRGSGFSFLHFDARIATTVQLVGRKAWSYADRSSLPWPAHNVRITDDGRVDWHQPPTAWEARVDLPGALQLTEVVLEPGHVLCLPAGTFHTAKAVDELSLSININFNYGGFFGLLMPYLQHTLAELPAWREPPPAAIGNDDTAGPLPAQIADFIRARIADVRRALDALDGGGNIDKALLWHGALHAPEFGAPRTLDRPLTPANVLHVASASFVQESASRGYVVSARGAVEITGAALFPFLRELVQQRSFSAGEALAWSGSATPYGWDMLHPILASLIERGVLVLAP